MQKSRIRSFFSRKRAGVSGNIEYIILKNGKEVTHKKFVSRDRGYKLQLRMKIRDRENWKMKLENLKIFDKIAAGQQVRIAFMGSSCTERWEVGAHWSDFLHIGFTHKFRRLDGSRCDNAALFLNAGTSNNTTGELLDRFARDIAPFQPDLILFMIGGNDSNPARNTPLETYLKNLECLKKRCEGIGAQAIFQTYYACDAEKFAENYPEWTKAYPEYMKALCEFAGESGIDHFSRWELLRKYNVKLFRLLMRDTLHVNPVGNAVIGLDLMRMFDLPLPDENLPWIRDALFAQLAMDALEKLEKSTHP